MVGAAKNAAGERRMIWNSDRLFTTAAAAVFLGLFQHLLWNQGKPQKTLVGIVVKFDTFI